MAGDISSYTRYLEATGVRDLAATVGNRGVLVLRRFQDGVTTFGVISLWGSLDEVRAFAGPRPEKAVYYPDDERYLLDRSPTVGHYDIVAGASLPGSTTRSAPPEPDAEPAQDAVQDPPGEQVTVPPSNVA